MGINIKHQNGHNSGSQGIPKGQNLASSPCPQRLWHTQRRSILIEISSFYGFWGRPKSAQSY